MALNKPSVPPQTIKPKHMCCNAKEDLDWKRRALPVLQPFRPVVKANVSLITINQPAQLAACIFSFHHQPVPDPINTISILNIGTKIHSSIHSYTNGARN